MDINIVDEYKNLFLPILSLYALVFHMAGILSWKLHVVIKLWLQLLAWWQKKFFCETALIFKALNANQNIWIRISEVKSSYSVTFYPLPISIAVVVLFWSWQSFHFSLYCCFFCSFFLFHSVVLFCCFRF